MYRYRYEGSTTHGARERFDWILRKLGRIQYIKGYRYHGKYQAQHERVLIRGTKGTARLSGLLWGYLGEGPHGTRELLLKLGMPLQLAEEIAFRTSRYAEDGEDWILYLLPYQGGTKQTRLLLRRGQTDWMQRNVKVGKKKNENEVKSAA